MLCILASIPDIFYVVWKKLTISSRNYKSYFHNFPLKVNITFSIKFQNMNIIILGKMFYLLAMYANSMFQKSYLWFTVSKTIYIFLTNWLFAMHYGRVTWPILAPEEMLCHSSSSCALLMMHLSNHWKSLVTSQNWRKIQILCDSKNQNSIKLNIFSFIYSLPSLFFLFLLRTHF